MSIVGVKFKIMPESPNTDLSSLKEEIKKKIEFFDGGRVDNFEEEPIAFGLKALIVTFALSEKEETEKVEAAVQEVGDVSSVEMTDYRRAIG